MSEPVTEQPDYGNLVSTRLLYVPGAGVILLVGLFLLAPIAAVVATLFLVTFAYFAYARYRFSPAGGNVQARIQCVVMDHLEGETEWKVIDIGCGNGAVAIMVAKKHPRAQVTGVD